MKREFLIILLSVLCSYSLFSKIIGTHKINNFTREVYEADAPNWDVVQSSDGKMYFGNSYGLLEFDGKFWRIVVQSDNRSIIRSLAIDKNDRIYIGSINEIGYSDRNSINRRNYISLNHKIPAQFSNFSQVWNIVFSEGKVIFQSPEYILFYDGDTITGINAPEKFLCLTKIHNKLFVIDSKEGLYRLKGSKLIRYSDHLKLPSNPRFIFPFGLDRFIIGTENNGMYLLEKGNISPWRSEANQFVKQFTLYCGNVMNDGEYAIGTIDGGVVIFNSNGQIMYHIDMAKGLLASGVTAIYKDYYNNIWLTLYNGISYVELGSSYTYLNKDNGLYGSVYCSRFFQDKLYIATNQGVYYAEIDKKAKELFAPAKVTLIPNSTNPTWNLEVINDKLYLARHNGFFVLDNNQLTPIYENTDGAWKQLLVPGREDKLIQGTYKGFILYNKVDSRWIPGGYINGYDDFARQFDFDSDGNLWLVNGLRGIYRFRLNDKCDSFERIRFFDESNGLPSHLFNNLFKIDNEIFFGTQAGVYRFDEQVDSMIPDKFYSQVLGNETLIRELKSMSNNKLFFVKGYDNKDEVGEIIINEDGTVKINYLPFQILRGKMQPSFEDINVVNKDYIAIGTKQGLIIYNKNERNYKETFMCNVSRVSCTSAKDSLIFGTGYFNPDKLPGDDYFKILGEDHVEVLPYELNALRISYSAAFFEKTDDIKYQTYLEGFDRDWTAWSSYNEREFTNIPEGNYTFRVRAKNVYNISSIEAIYRFKILPPWYRSRWMYIFYSFIGVVVIVILIQVKNYQVRYEKRKLRLEQITTIRKRQEQYRKEKLQSEKRIVQLHNEKLKSEFEHQSKELASSTLNLVKMNEALVSIKDQILNIKEKSENSTRHRLDKTISFIDRTLSDEEQWSNFELHFNKVHNNFLKRLKSSYSQLTNRDLRLCAYLRMNLSSKEIAPLMGITYRSVEALRYRIRKKFRMQPDEKLIDFILEF